MQFNLKGYVYNYMLYIYHHISLSRNGRTVNMYQLGYSYLTINE